MEMTDWQFVQKFADNDSGSQAAFSELVRRYTNLVYRVCLRELNDAALTEDTAQAVFLVLARKAPTLRPTRQDATLSSWLFQTALLTARNVRRQEQRRQAREQEAAQMQVEQSAGPGWADIEPLLNDALATLPAGQRSLILERFFHERPLAEIGAGLGVSEDAARMRVNRALDRLRRFFAARNVALSAAALAAFLPQAVRPAPAHAADTLARLRYPSPSGVTAPTTAQTIAQGAIHTMNLKHFRLQLGVAALIAAFVLGTAGAVRVTSQRRAQAVRAGQQQSAAQAHAVLDQMYATYAAMHSFKCNVSSREEPLGTAQDAEYEIERPNKIRFRRVSLLGVDMSGRAQAVSDGKNLYVTCTEANGPGSNGLADRYVKMPLITSSTQTPLNTPGDFRYWFSDFGGIAGWGTETNAGMPDVMLGIRLHETPSPQFKAPEYSMGQPTTIDFSGVAYPVALDVVVARIPYAAGTPGRDWPGAAETVTFYIGQKDHLLYQVVATDPLGPKDLDTMTQTINGMEINQQQKASDFVFAPPPGSHEVQGTSNLFPGGQR